MNLFTEGYMKNQLNKTVTVLQKLTNKISDIKEKTDEFLVEQDYQYLNNYIDSISGLLNNEKIPEGAVYKASDFPDEMANGYYIIYEEGPGEYDIIWTNGSYFLLFVACLCQCQNL